MNFLETVIRLIILRCDSYLKEKSGEGIDTFEKFPAVGAFMSGLEREDIKHWALVTGEAKEKAGSKGKKNGSGASKKKAGAGSAGGNSPEERYLSLIEMLGGDNVLVSLLDFCLAVFAIPEFDAYLIHHFGYSVNLHLACLLEQENFPGESRVLDALSRAEAICDVDRSVSPLQYATLSIDERVFAYASGDDRLSPRLSDFTELFKAGGENGLHESFVNGELIEKGTKFFKGGGKVLHLCGRGGRRFAAKSVAADINKDFLFLNIADLFTGNKSGAVKELRGALIREARFDGAGICLYGITQHFIGGRDTAGPSDNIRARRDLALLERLLFVPIVAAGIPLILISDAPVILMRSLSDREYSLIELPASYDYEGRTKLWEGLAKLHGLELDAKDYAMKYHLNASEAAGVIKSFLERREGGDEENTLILDAAAEKLITRISIERIEDAEGKDTGRVIYPATRLDDVKVKKEIRAVLDDVVNSVRLSAMILDTWGLRENYPYGRCVSLLLSGPPGTGKTMTANAIAGELGLPLYQINLSSIVDKYIGETEKNLEKAFSYAEKTNTVLFFDEADSLFGTRSQVHDAKDRHANTEVSYLLQRIEAYDGVVIMATNIKGNIDPAFMRRIRYVVNYENPDEALRRAIWAGCLKEGVPHGDIDLDYLAAQFDKFTGSVIKTVFLNACAYAAGRNESLEMLHIVHALKHELEKASSVTFTRDELGKYAYLA
ncbi:MAG: ATP-binding protein [Lachnospiraceae bacterium]|nr:ATP-binding protein [Lachnospiraceae bacterium]